MNPFVDEHISDMEKIDRIYRMLRAEQRSRWVGRGVKLVLLAIAVYGYYYLAASEHEDVRSRLMQSFQSQISAIATPMVETMVGDMTASMVDNIGMTGAIRHRNIPRGSGQTTPMNISPEMIRAVQEGVKR